MKIKELSILPYPGRAFLARNRKDFVKAHALLFKRAANIYETTDGICAWQADDEGYSYLLWGDDRDTLSHELSHLILDVFQRIGIDPREANGEPFCYMLSHLLNQVEKNYGKRS